MAKRKNQFRVLTKKFPSRMQKKLAMLFLAIVLAFMVLIGRITYINASNGEEYAKIILNQEVYDSRVIPFKRGDILDRNGTKVASSERVYNLVVDAKVLLTDEDDVEPTIDVLVSKFGVDENTLRTLLKDKPDSSYNVVMKGLTYEQSKQFDEIVQDDETYPNFNGVWLEDDYVRNYPYNSLASDVIGFTVGSNAGAIGIESAYNSILNGTNGREYGYFGSDSVMEQTVVDPKAGNTIVSTIDVTLQGIVEQAILEFNEAHRGTARPDELGSKNTAVIVMDPDNGEILAEASYPNFDLNNPRDLVATGLYNQEQVEAMSEEEETDAMNSLWRNFCVSDAFEPGSTAKPFTVAGALESGAITGDETYVCGGSLHVGDYDINCHFTLGHGTQTVEDAIANSCNVALMHIAEAQGIEDFTRYQSIFGFGQYTGIDLPGEAETSGLIYTKDTMQVTDLATNSFGQSFNITMTQLAAGFCSLVNGGNYYEPHIVKEIRDENGNVIETKNPVLLKKTISEDTSTKVKQYMRAVVQNPYGTGTGMQVEGYDIGGKTGTAEKLPRGNNKYVLSFIGYAPQEHPEVVIYVVIDEPNTASQEDSSLIAGLSQKIFAQVLPYLNVPTVDGYVPPETTENTTIDTTTYTDTTEYTDYDANYEDTYDNVDGEYVDESYQPDYTDWAAQSYSDEAYQ